MLESRSTRSEREVRMDANRSERGNAGIAVLVVLSLTALGVGTAGVVRGGARSSRAVQAASVPYLMAESGTGHVVSVDLTANDTTIQEIAPGVKFNAWTFNGTAPGPVIRVQQGDTVQFTLHNASKNMSHSIDFHAAQTPWDVNYQAVAPGKVFTFSWVARFPGVFMYHCGTPPVIQHISNGMYGAIVVEPAQTLAPAREYVLVQSEFYPSAQPTGGVYYGDYNAMLANQPQYIVFNGEANQFKDHPLVARPGELIRLWVVDAGPSHWSAFHVIGALFDSAYASRNPANDVHGVQTVTIAPGDGWMMELRIPDAGLYPFVTHSFADAGRGALGIIKVDPKAPAAPKSYPTMGDPMTAGVTADTATGTTGPSTGGTGMAGMPMPSPAAGGTSSPPGAASCMPMGTKLEITAPAGASTSGFDKTCLAAPAGLTFTVTFKNLDTGIPHNFAIYSDSNATTWLGGAESAAKIVMGPGSVTYTIKGLPAGQYFFRCDIHPQTMKGVFIVAGGH